MEISSIFLGLVGIVVSVGTFITSYKQTIGARKERARNVINEVNKILYRNLILEEFIPSCEEINRILSSKILEYRIKKSDLPNGIDFLNTIYTKLVEDELIEFKIKNKLISKIDEKIKLEIKKIFIEEPIGDKEDKDKSFFFITALISMFAGMLTFLLPLYKFRIPSPDIDNVIIIVMMFISIVVALMFTQNILKQKNRDNQESSPTKSRIKDMVDFENRVYKKLKNSGFESVKRDFRLEKDEQKFMIDFYAQKNKQHYYIEVKNFRNITPSFILQNISHISSEIKKIDKKAKLILITKDRIIINEKIRKYLDNWDYILDETSLDKLKRI